MLDYETKVNGYRIDAWFNYDHANGGSDIYYTVNGGTVHGASLIYCAWAQRLHGNAPSGTHYASFRATLPNGHRVTVRCYL